mmetsp:Transcript_33064/g.29300  ORF Transcript_33064/g.29300 Transcript_33064/m.29300 type:complete len:81 (-) Transcript_33064:239-481(-)
MKQWNNFDDGIEDEYLLNQKMLLMMENDRLYKLKQERFNRVQEDRLRRLHEERLRVLQQSSISKLGVVTVPRKRRGGDGD